MVPLSCFWADGYNPSKTLCLWKATGDGVYARRGPLKIMPLPALLHRLRIAAENALVELVAAPPPRLILRACFWVLCYLTNFRTRVLKETDPLRYNHTNRFILRELDPGIRTSEPPAHCRSRHRPLSLNESFQRRNCVLRSVGRSPH